MLHAKHWEYDARIGRRWNPDPFYKHSPYEAFGGNPITYADPDGADTVNINRVTTRFKMRQSKSGLDFLRSGYKPDKISRSVNIDVKAAEGEDVFRIIDTEVTIDEDGNVTTVTTPTTLEINNKQTFYRTGGHNMKGYIDDRYALAANAPDWLLDYYAEKSGDIGVRAALAYQKDIPFADKVNKIASAAYTISGAYGVFRFALSRTAFTSYVNLASRQRTVHILAGDATGGGHSWFGSLRSFANGLTGKKSMFPMGWSQNKIMHAVSDVTVNNPWVQITGRAGAQFTRNGAPVRYAVEGYYEGVKIKVITTADDIITAFPMR
jgi:hypothetical protein